MIRLLSISILAGLIIGTSASADPIKVRLQTIDRKVHIGSLVKREAGSVQFKPSGDSPLVRLTDAQIAYIQFPVEDEDEEQIKRLFDEGEYQQLAEPLNELLPPYMEYITLPSNLTQKFRRWMIVSYWTGNVDRTLQLADALERFQTEGFQEDTRFYRGLAQLEKGDLAALEKFLATDEGAQTYPKDSAARLYIEARLLMQKEEYIPAIRTAALLMAKHSRDADWMPKTELLCAKIYYRLDMPESAEAVLKDIREFYADPTIQKKAAAIAAGK